MKNVVLQLLRIFEERTDSDHALTKREILQELSLCGYDIEEKQFYRKIEELSENGYEIKKRKGRQTYYYMSRDRLTRGEWIFLLTLILGNRDLSKRETNHMIAALENMSVCYESVRYAGRYKDKMNSDKCPFGQLKNFRELLDAMDGGKEVVYTLLSRDGEDPVFSERRRMKPLDFAAIDNRIVITAEDEGVKREYLLADLLDVEVV